MTELDERLIQTRRCCRDWDIWILAPVGRCGYCRERPR